MQRGCYLIEAEPGKWYCVVATQEHDYDFEHATTNGPEPTEEQAFKNHAGCNPGGSTTINHASITDYERKLLARYPPPKR